MAKQCFSRLFVSFRTFKKIYLLTQTLYIHIHTVTGKKMMLRVLRRRLLTPVTATTAPATASTPHNIHIHTQAPPTTRAYHCLASTSSLRRPPPTTTAAPLPSLSLLPRSFAAAAADLGKGIDIFSPASTEEGGGELEGGKERTFLLGYDGQGFEVRDVNFRGSILALPNACFLWKPRRLEEITPEALAPLLLVKPPIEIVIVGSGEKLERPLPKETLEFMAAKGIAVEHMDTASACSTFNILNQEDRRVAGALLAVDEEETM